MEHTVVVYTDWVSGVGYRKVERLWTLTSFKVGA